MLDEVRAANAASDVELVIGVVPQLEQPQRTVRMPGFGRAV